MVTIVFLYLLLQHNSSLLLIIKILYFMFYIYIFSDRFGDVDDDAIDRSKYKI